MEAVQVSMALKMCTSPGRVPRSATIACARSFLPERFDAPDVLDLEPVLLGASSCPFRSPVNRYTRARWCKPVLKSPSFTNPAWRRRGLLSRLVTMS